MHHFEQKRLESKRTRARAKGNHKSIIISLSQSEQIIGLGESFTFIEIIPHSRQHTVLLQHRMSTSRLFRGCFIKMFHLCLCFDLEMAWAVARYWMQICSQMRVYTYLLLLNCQILFGVRKPAFEKCHFPSHMATQGYLSEDSVQISSIQSAYQNRNVQQTGAEISLYHLSHFTNGCFQSSPLCSLCVTYIYVGTHS